MNWIIPILSIAAAFGIPTAATSFFIRRFEKRLDAREAEQRRTEDKIAAAQKRSMVLVVKGVGAAISLGEATAKAVQRIPDAHCNGEMKDALEYAQAVKHEQKDFLTEQAAENLLN